MKSKLVFVVTLLFFSVPAHAESFKLSGETGFISGNFKGNYKRQLGYESWKGMKSNFLYRLNVEDLFKIKKGTSFTFSIISGNTKSPYISLFSSENDELFGGGIKTFDVKELYFRKEGFVFNNLTLTAGKQQFKFLPLLYDYLWGGKFTYRLNKFLSFTWNQIAGYEGNYLLFNNENEDDVDVFGPTFKLQWEPYRLEISALRISDARGNRNGVSKDAVLCSLTYNLNNNFSFFLSGVYENGNPAIYGKLNYESLSLSGGYSDKNFTSYGFGEGVRGIGFLYRPSYSNLQFLKASYRFSLNPFDFRVYGVHLENANGKLIGNEIGGEVNYPFLKGSLFLQSAVGRDGAYALYGGYRWGVQPFNYLSHYHKLNVKLKNYFNIVGEYADFSKRWYVPQNGYEGWERARHVGFWHSTYKLTLKSNNLKVKVSTGRDSKVDYVVWGNTADNFKYSKTHGKLWHFEELNYHWDYLKFGLQPVNVLGFTSENLAGLLFNRWFSAGYFFEQHGERERGSSKFQYLYLSLPYRGFFLSYLYRTNRSDFNSLYSLGYSDKNLKVAYLKEYGTETEKSWGGFLSGKMFFHKFKFTGLYKVYSKDFHTFGLKEYTRNDGYIYRPGERDVRFEKLTVSKGFRFGFKKIDRLSPKIKLLYDRLSTFSGNYVGEEGGIAILIKPGRKCKLSLVGTVGNGNSYYEGLEFNLKW